MRDSSAYSQKLPGCGVALKTFIKLVVNADCKISVKTFFGQLCTLGCISVPIDIEHLPHRSLFTNFAFRIMKVIEGKFCPSAVQCVCVFCKEPDLFERNTWDSRQSGKMHSAFTIL